MAPIEPQLLCGDVYSISEHGSFCTCAVVRPVCEPTYIMPVSGSTALPPSMFTPPLAPGAYHEHLYCAWPPPCAMPLIGDGGMKYGPMRQIFASFSAESLMAGV